MKLSSSLVLLSLGLKQKRFFVSLSYFIIVTNNFFSLYFWCYQFICARCDVYLLWTERFRSMDTKVFVVEKVHNHATVGELEKKKTVTEFLIFDAFCLFIFSNQRS